MKRLFVITAMLLASTAARAGDSYSFDIAGYTIHIEGPSKCGSPPCVSPASPGANEPGPKRAKRIRAVPQPDPRGKPAPQQARVTPPPAAAPVQAAAAPEPAAITAPAAAAPATETLARIEPAAPRPRAPQDGAPAPKPTVVAAAPVAAPLQRQQVPAAAPPAATPLGVWLTEAKEGMVRIEACGGNLCGYAVNTKTNLNADKILINMKPAAEAKWAGRIFDPNSGSTYDSTIALQGRDSLRVQGCAFGGMFCGGQTWSRMN